MLRKKLQIFLMFCLLFCLCHCSSDDPAIETEKPDNKEEPGDGAVFELKPSDIQDYYKIYKPNEFKNINWLREDSKWSFVRSKQSEHFIVFWEKGFTENPNSTSLPEVLRVDIDDLLAKAESFFRINVEKLKFAELGNSLSNLDKYKMQIYLHYREDWMAYGSGYDDVIGAIWVSPPTCKPVGSTIAHEIGHSFQYQVYADLLAAGKTLNDYSRGFRYGYGGNGGNGFWEQTAQWQSFQSYPREVFGSDNFNVYTKNYHRNLFHEWQRYASYFIHYYWANKHGNDFIGKLWRESLMPEDPAETYMRLNKLTVDQFNDEIFEAVSRFVTWDIDEIRSNGESYIGKHSYLLYSLTDGSYQVAYSKCPGTTGYNVIPLNVPEAGTVIAINFNGIRPGSPLTTGDPGLALKGDQTIKVTSYNKSDISIAGWRYGFVALLNNGKRVYGEMNSEPNAKVEFIVPENCNKIWFVVLGAPSVYNSHAWDENESNDDQWPYKIIFEGTDILGNITIDPNASPKDITLTYNLSIPADANTYSGIEINMIENRDIYEIAQAFVMQPAEMVGIMLDPKQHPQENKIAFASIESDGRHNYDTTANGYGFWFNKSGDVVGWGSESFIFSEFTHSDFTFFIGQYPNKCKKGDKFTIKEALIYTKNDKQYKAIFQFNITIT